MVARLWSFRWGRLVSRDCIRVVSFVLVPAVCLLYYGGGRLGFLFVAAFRRSRSFRFPVTAIRLFSQALLTFCCSFSVQRSWPTICAEMEVWNILVGIVTFN